MNLQSVRSRFSSVVLTFIGLTVVTFMIGRVIPIDPVVAIVGNRAPPQVYDRVRKELGLDLPLYKQYAMYMTKVAHGDFGNSVISSRPVLSERELLRCYRRLRREQQIVLAEIIAAMSRSAPKDE